MALEVLQSRSQVNAARKKLRALGLSHVPGTWHQLLRMLRLDTRLAVGDKQKSWDVLRSLEFIDENLSKDSQLLDIGCFCSEILPSLYCAGYVNLTGVDLNPQISQMPYSGEIHYSCQDFMRTDFRPNTFDAVISISVIEHGFNPQALLREVSRLLRTGGYFIASFDYWPEKIDTDKIRIFDMSWQIFSDRELLDFVSQAQLWGLELAGDVSLTASDRVVSCLGKQYTFGWLVLQKQHEKTLS